MIIEALLSPIIFIVGKIFDLVNFDSLDLPFWLVDTLSLLQKGMMFFPVDVYVIIMANIIFWLTLQFGWSIVEWIYKKIPGIN